MYQFLRKYWQTGVIILVGGGLIVLGLSGYLSPVIRLVSSPFIGAQRWISTRYIAIAELISAPSDVASLRQRNSELESENASLRSQVVELRQQLQEVNVLYSLLDFARAHPENEYIAAAVIGKDPSPFLHYIFIDQGSDAGILHGMPVVTSQGLVGRVDAVTAGASRVHLITDPGSTINIILQSNQAEALMKGSITGDVTLDQVAQDVDLKVGEIVLTSGAGGNYPANLLVGQVVNVRKRENDLYQTATIQPVVDFSRLQAVMIIKSFKPIDLTPLVPK